MQNTTTTFAYTARRGPYISTISALLFLMIGEVGGITFLIARFLSIGVLKWLLMGALMVLYLFIAIKLLLPLWTRHRLSAAHLHLHYGLDFKASIPRAHIVSVERVRERVVMPVARYEAEKQRLNIAFSEHGQLLLRLDRPYPFQIGFGKKMFAEKILLNVDQSNELLAALKPGLIPAAKPAHDVQIHPVEREPMRPVPAMQARAICIDYRRITTGYSRQNDVGDCPAS